MYHTILVPLDGSPFGERALPMATTLARAAGAHLVLVRAASASPLPGQDPVLAECRVIEEAERYLSDLAARLTEQEIPIATAVPYGPASEAILIEVGLHCADLVVMCTHGRSGLGRWVYGSVAEAVLAHSPVPVLLVRPAGAQVILSSEPKQPGLLVPLDGSRFAEAALPHAAGLARTFSGAISLLHVVVPPVMSFIEESVIRTGTGGITDEILQKQTRLAASYLATVAERLQGDAIRVQTVVRVGAPADAILLEAQTIGARLILMATHGRTGLGRLLLGSTALEVVRRTLLPVLLVHPTVLPTA